MLFTSLTFLAFLAVVAFIYHLLPLTWRRPYLLAASIAFYCTWSIPFAVLLLAVSALTYALALRIEAETEKAGRWLLVGIFVLFAPLLVFKYFSGFGSVVALYLGRPDTSKTFSAIGLLAPIGLSYYTFKLVSYLTDVYWGRLRASRRFTDVAAYATFFPQILSGPIQRAGDFIGQIETIKPTTKARVASGLQLLLFGFFKKLVIADRIAVIIDPIYVSPPSYSDLTVAVATYLFAVQLYADFSGLTDIARGVARLVGIESPKNFDQPYYAENIQEFWRRWHMSLTNWVRDYVFIPLRMALRNWGHFGLVLSIFVNMVLVGLWHGPWLTFIVFGLVHGAYVYGSAQTFRARKAFYGRVPALKAMHVVTGPLITFHMLYATLPFFRAGSLPDAWSSVRKCVAGVADLVLSLGSPTHLAHTWSRIELKWTQEDLVVIGLAVVVMEVVHTLQARHLLPKLNAQTPGALRWMVYYGLGISILIWGEMGSRQFIYAGF